jgi:hypothetical protein
LIEAELLNGIMLSSNLYLWTAPAWLLWYLLASSQPECRHEFDTESRSAINDANMNSQKSGSCLEHG